MWLCDFRSRYDTLWDGTDQIKIRNVAELARHIGRKRVCQPLTGILVLQCLPYSASLGELRDMEGTRCNYVIEPSPLLSIAFGGLTIAFSSLLYLFGKGYNFAPND